MKQFKKENLLTSELELSHPLLKLFGILPSQFYADEFVHFGEHYDYPIVIARNGRYTVISNVEEVYAAVNAKLEKIDVWVAEGFDEEELPRFINHRAFYKYKNRYTVKFDLISYLEHHLTNSKYGRKWAAEVPGDMKKKLSTILGVSETQIHNIKTIGSHDRSLLDEIDNRERQFAKTLEKVKNQKNPEPKPSNLSCDESKNDGQPILKLSNAGEMCPQRTFEVDSYDRDIISNFKIKSFKLYDEEGHEIAFLKNDDKSVLTLDGKPVIDFVLDISDSLGTQNFKSSSTKNSRLKLSVGLEEDDKIVKIKMKEGSILTPQLTNKTVTYAA